MKSTPRKFVGISLIEMMVSLAVGMLVLSGAIYMTTSGTRAKAESMRMARLNQGLRGALLVIGRDLQRSGAWDAAQDVTRVALNTGLTLSGTVSGSSVTITPGTANKDFDLIDGQINGRTLIYIDQNGSLSRATITAASASSITATLNSSFPTRDIPAGTWSILSPARGVDVRDQDNVAVSTGTAGSCVVFRYDLDKDGVITPSGSGNESFGYRYNSTNQTVDTRTTNAACDGTGWQAITDSGEIQVTSFSITEEGAVSVGTGPVQNIIRTYTISLAGRLTRDTSVTRTLTSRIKVRNDDIVYSSAELSSIESGI